MYVIEKYTIISEKMDSFTAYIKKASHLMKKNPEKFKGLVSWKLFQNYFGTWGAFYEVWEVGSFTDFEKIMQTMLTDKELKVIPEEFFGYVIPGTHHMEIINKIESWVLK